MRGMQAWLMGVAGLALALGSCGKVADGGGDILLDSNTNWLKRCEFDSECSGSLVCLCGQCTQPCAESTECGLLSGATCGSASGGACEQNPGAGGLCVLECTSASECGDDDFTCSDGQCVPLPREEAPAEDVLTRAPDESESGIGCARNEILDMDDVFEIIDYDLAGEDFDDTSNYRYFSLANRWNAGLCQHNLDVDRAALNKALNSLSLAPAAEAPLQVDDKGFIYRIDLRDYAWDREVVLYGESYPNAWEMLVAQDIFTVPWEGDTADEVTDVTGTELPVMFVSSFISAATVAGTYYALLDIDENLDAYILEELGIDVQANLLDQEVIRAGFSGVYEGFSEGAFIAERHDTESRTGYLWQINRVSRTPSELFQHILTPTTGEREIVFTLPNGFLAFALADASGTRVNESAMVSMVDAEVPLRASFGRYGDGFRVRDEVRATIESEVSTGHVNVVGDVALINVIYPDADRLTAVLDEDRDEYAGALARADLDSGGRDPITRLYAAFEGDVDLNAAAGDLMMAPDQLQRNIAELRPSMQVLDGGRISRQEFAGEYVRSLCTMTIALENMPNMDLCDQAFARP